MRHTGGRARPRSGRVLVLLALLGALSGCAGQSGSSSAPSEAALPDSPTPCASRTEQPSPSPTPRGTRLAWRAEELPDGAVRMTVGDVEAAPRHPEAERVYGSRAPRFPSRCHSVRTVKVDGWWCTTTVEPIEVNGEIVLGDAEPRARIGGAGFGTRCSDRPHRMRQVYRVERDSWSGWRDYGELRRTEWTRSQDQRGGRVAVPCPTGRVGTYDYRLSVRLEIDGVRVGDARAASAQIRTHCGTGVS